MRKPISRRYWLYGIPIVLLAAPLYFIRARYSPEGQLHYHRNLWASKRIPRYSYTLLLWHGSGPRISSTEIRVTIDEKKKPIKHFRNAIYYTMMRHFHEIEKHVEDKRKGAYSTVSVLYDKHLGRNLSGNEMSCHPRCKSGFDLSYLLIRGLHRAPRLCPLPMSRLLAL